MIKIRLFDKNDWPAVWQIIGPVFRAGETYPFSTEISEEEAYTAWIDNPSATYIAEDEDNNVDGGGWKGWRQDLKQLDTGCTQEGAGYTPLRIMRQPRTRTFLPAYMFRYIHLMAGA